MITLEVSGSIGLPPSDFIEELAAKSVASTSRRFAEYLKNRRFDELFETKTGKTKESIDIYRYKSKNPAYVVKAGVGIPGNLNYLMGLYRGRATSRSGKVFSYARPRDLLTEGWKAWGGEGKLQAASEEMLNKMISDWERKK